MSFTDSIKDTYYSLEDKWYALVDKISEKVPVFGNTVDYIEEKNIPSFPAAIVLLLIIIFLIIWIFSLNLTSVLTISVVDSEEVFLSGANVYVYSNSELVGQNETDAEGKAYFKLASGKYTVKVEKNGYGTETKEVDAASSEKIKLLGSGATTKTIYMKTADGKIISGSGTVKYYCDGSNEEKFAFYKDGKFDVDFGNECTEIMIESVSGYKVVLGKASFSGSEVTLEEVEVLTGTIRVNLVSTDLVPQGLKVVLSSEDGVPVQTRTTETSVVVFEDVPTKKYYITMHDPRIDVTVKYENYDGKKLGELKEVKIGETTEFTINLVKTVSKKIMVTVRDVDSGNVIKGTEVGLTLVSNSTKVETKITGITGQVMFDVVDGEVYAISADHPEYIVGAAKSVTSEQTEVVMELVKATSENSQSVKVNVVDNEGKPIDNAKVTLKKLDNTEIDQKTTGADGTTEFYNLEINQSYYVYVAKDRFSANSGSVTVAPRRQSTLEVKLSIGKGKINVITLDQEKSVVKGATIKLINYYTQSIEEQKSTDNDGKATFEIRADKLVYFVSEASGFVKYTTATITPDADSEQEKEIILQKSSGKLEAKIVSMNLGNNALTENDAERTVGTGNYTLKAIVNVPKGTYSEAGIHLRTGKAIEGTTNTMEEDALRLGDVRSAASRTIKGTTYTPNTGYDTDSKNLTQGDSKWVNFIFRNATEGTYEVEADIRINEINQLQGLNLWYRAWTKGSNVLRDPQSNTSGTNELYAPAKNYILTGGATNLCSNGYCKTNTIEVMSGNDKGKKYYITNNFNAKKDVTYMLTTELTNNSGKSVNGAILNIDSVGTDINLITINGTDYTTKEINVGTIGVDSYNKISIIFTPRMTGNNIIKMNLNSTTKTEFEQTITLPVKANKVFELKIIPREIIPYLVNNLFFEVIDGNTPLSGVTIEIKNKDNFLGSVETSGEGLATYELAAPSVGDTIIINAMKEGYDSILIEKEVSKSILIITPPQISETIKIGEVKSITQTVLMQNATVKDIKINSVSFSGDLQTYLDLKFNETITGSVIEKNKDKNYSLTIKPNASAKKLKEPKNLTGELIIETEIEGTTQKYENKVPITIRLSMPGYIDNERCLKITPSTIEFIASGTEATQNIEIENVCTAEGIPVTLHDIEAKTNEASNLGAIIISGDGLSGAVNNTYTKIGEFLEKGTKQTISVRFVPNGSISSGTQELKITFKGTNIPEENEKEEIETSFNAKITMSNLSKCIEVEEPTNGIVLDVASWNLGYNQLLNTNLSAYAQNYQGFSSRTNTMPYGMTNALPFMNQNFTGQQTQSTYEQSSFVIKNNCAVDVDIDLDPDSRVNVSQEKFTIGSDSDYTVSVTPGYTLGRYKISVNARPTNTEESYKKIDDVSVLVRKLGDIDNDCIKVNTTTITLNSFLYTSEKYKVYNLCYDSGVSLPRTNTAVSIQCNGPSAGISVMGQMNQYQNPLSTLQQQGYVNSFMNPYGTTNYPTNDTFTNNTTNNPGCMGNQCTVITGTRVTNYNLIEKESGTTEEITFEVIPNPTYIPQTKLFNSQTGQGGAFQTIMDLRRWATETDSRTNIYGNINVQYNNQYGQTQCMSFPVTIEDSWRMLESIDSVINWGDPNARAEECVSQTETESALNIYDYWLKRGNTKGAIPETAYNGGVYLYLPQTPTVKIGPAPTLGMSQTYYPNMQYYNNYQGQNYQQVTQNTSEAKNCGLLDKLSNIVYQKEFEGVILTVEGTTKGGSILNNTKGPNLMVSINRSGIKTNCVYIETQVTAKLTRAVNFQSGEVRWNLKALVTAPDYTLLGKDLEEIKKECVIIKDTNAGPSTTVKGCSSNANNFGFNLIGKTNYEKLTEEEYKNYCTEKFCNNDMLQIILRDKIKQIENNKNSTNLTTFCTEKGTIKLSELYKEAQTTDLNVCGDATKTENKYFLKQNNDLIEQKYTIPKEILEENKEKIDEIKKGSTATNPSIIDTATILNELENKENVFIKISSSKLPDNVPNKKLLELGIKKVGSTNYYMNLGYYISLNENIDTTENSSCIKEGTNCTIKICGTDVEVNPEIMQWIENNFSGIIKAISVDTKDKNEIEKIYVENTKLNNLHKFATFSSNLKEKRINTTLIDDLYLTQIDKESTAPKEAQLANELLNAYGENKYKIVYANNITPGKYEAELDMNLCATPSGDEVVEVEFKTTKENQIKDAADLKKNILLQTGFNHTINSKSLADSSNGIILRKTNTGVELLPRIPIKIDVTLNPQEIELKYAPTTAIVKVTAGSSLINWTENGKSTKDTKSEDGKYVYSVAQKLETKQLSGIYYYPEEGQLEFFAGNGGGNFTATAIGIDGINYSASDSLPTPRSNTTRLIQLGYQAYDLEKTISLVNEGKACIATDGQTIQWNETNLLK